MSIIIYWSCTENEWLRAKEPEPIYKNFVKNIKNKSISLHMCPAIKDYKRNIFGIKSLYDYNFTILKNEGEDEKVFSNLYDQNFFNKHVTVRSIEDKIFSFSQNFVFFTEEKSLLMSAINPYMEQNVITERCITIPGTFNIGKWFRSIEFAFFLKKDFDTFEIKEEDIYQYIKFHTDEKIIFKQFKTTETIFNYLEDTNNAKASRLLKPRSLNDYYVFFSNKKNIIKEIKKNLI